jgi:tripartite-type tricarboxylate transporter receptor subunit TctC
MDISAWFGLFAPAGTPASIVNLLNTQVNQLLVDPTYVDRVRTLGHSEYQTLSPPQFARVVRKDFSVWKEVIQKGKVRVE